MPEEALTGLGDRQFVFVVDTAHDNAVERREVRLGARRPGFAEIVAGLKAGERVITQGAAKVKPGDRVAILAEDDGTQTLRDLVGRPRP